MRSAIYTGTVFHVRKHPKKHSFTYKLYMMFFDLCEIDELVSSSSLLSKTRWAPLQFKREDFHGDPSNSILEEIRKTVRAKLGLNLTGPVCALGNWRCFGLNFNPIVVYYCFDSEGEHLEAIVAEVTNTPWLERNAYVLRVDDHEIKDVHTRIKKDFTVSPFNPLNMDYEWDSSFPGTKLNVGIKSYQHDDLVFQAKLHLERIKLNKVNLRKNLRKIVLDFPFMTLKVVLAIYFEALKLYLKGVPFLGKDKRVPPLK